MAKGFLDNLIKELSSLPSDVLIIENNDGFLMRDDVKVFLNSKGFYLATGSTFEQRIQFELRDANSIFIFLNKDKREYLDDISKKAIRYEFFLTGLINGYHINSIKEEPLDLIERLPETVHNLNRRKTEEVISSLKSAEDPDESSDVLPLLEKLELIREDEAIDWNSIPILIGELLKMGINTNYIDRISDLVDSYNSLYHDSFKGVMNLQTASYLKSPKVVSHILPYIDANYQDHRLALIVIDGLAFWQYELLRQYIPGNIKVNPVHSWLPSITQLSRQAIFKGDKPERNYKQGPASEEKLWLEYWKSKGVPKTQIKYYYEPKDVKSFGGRKRVALVYKDLDDFMHSCKDYCYLKSMTEIWIERTSLFSNIKTLLDEGFQVFLATDHGNVEAQGWRLLSGREKLGTNKSGSRSQRHLEYSDQSSYDRFIKENQELEPSILKDEQTVYLKNNLSFSREESLVTHGGAHILEMLVPFVKITNE